MSAESFVDGPLTISLAEGVTTVDLAWSGRSIAREPALFVLPILSRALELGQRSEKRVVLDFSHLEYLNSSTITPLIRTLEQAKRGTAQITVRYDGKLKWQALAFSALYLFGTADGRIAIQGT